MSNTLDQLIGHQVPGGCDDCNAFQTVSSEAPGLYRLIVHHDPWCPFLKGLSS